MPETENKQQLNINTNINSNTNTNTNTNRLRLPLSSLLDRRASASTPNSTPAATSNNELTDSSPGDHHLLLQRRGSLSDINIGLNRTRAPSLAAIQERITRMKPDLLNNTTTPKNLENTPNMPLTHHEDLLTDPDAKEITQNKETTTNPDPVSQTPTEIKPSLETLHPLQHSWTLYFDTRLSKRSSTSHATGGQAYEAGLQPIGTFQSVEQFCSYFNWTVTPSQMDMNSSVQLFKAHIKPMWEDPANSKGGKWTITIKSNSNLALLDKLWTYLVLGLVGEQIETSTGPQDDDFVCGAIVATRPRGNRIQIWVKEKDNVEKINFLGKRLINVLEITDHSGVSVDFSAHTGGSHGASRFISIQGHANSSSPRGASSNAHTPIMRPALEGMMMGGMGRALEEKSMGGGMMRRSNSAEVSQLGAPRGVVGTAEFGSGAGFRGMAGAGRTSQLSSHDPPIQNGVWRPNNPGPAASVARPPGMSAVAAPAGPPGMMASFMAANRRPQSAMTLPTLGSMGTVAGGGGGGGLSALGAFQHTKQQLASHGKSSRQPSPAPPGSAPKTTVIVPNSSASSSSDTTPHSRNPSPAPPAAPLGRGILSGS